jgi:hypothetical protein
VVAALDADLAPGEAARRVHDIYGALVQSTNGLFRLSAAPTAEMELARIDHVLERQGYRSDRWQILGAYILAGGFGWVQNHKRRQGFVVPDMHFFFRSLSLEDAASGGRKTVVDGSVMLRSLHAALDWDEDGRKEVEMSAKKKVAKAGGVPRVEPPSDEAGRQSAADMRARGASGSGHVTTMSGDDILGQFEEPSVG